VRFRHSRAADPQPAPGRIPGHGPVGVIDINDPSGRTKPAGDEERGRFLDALRARGIAFVRRYSGGPDIHAACGMLASTARGGKPA
jgi:adenine C2-methylase RlmN of 23S rRNA A2503 and tRNA A37